MQLPCMTMRRWLVAVLVIGVVLGVVVVLDRGLRWQRFCMLRADQHRQAQVELETIVSGASGGLAGR